MGVRLSPSAPFYEVSSRGERSLPKANKREPGTPDENVGAGPWKAAWRRTYGMPSLTCVSMATNSLGDKITRLRKTKGISQELLAENSRVSLRTIQRIESGSVIPRGSTVTLIAQTLGVPIDELTALSVNDGQLSGDSMAKVRQINLSALAGLLIPLTNLLVPMFLWRRYRSDPKADAIGRRIVIFQAVWTLTTIFTAVIVHVILRTMTNSVSIGRMPPVSVLVYLLFVTANAVITIRAAARLGDGDTGVYTALSRLF